MALHFRFLILHFIGFLKNPNDPDYTSATKRQKILPVCFYYLAISFVSCGIILWYPVEIAEKIGLFDELNGKDLETSILVRIALIIILAPLIEEGIFRLWLGLY